MVLKRGDEEFLGRLGAEDTDDEEFYLATRREKILLAEWIFDSMFGTTASIEGAEWNEVGTHREISRNSTEGGGASPRICISGPGHQGSQSPEIQGSLSGQHAGPATARSSAEEERSASAVEGSGI
ncbi:hypothetical protein N431DRAFT_438141 [Stipitochalara longipes BDJ]|nr:hypothetical protein N431DRAFT_438141 [Stipitochalara longipes BDJ]